MKSLWEYEGTLIHYFILHNYQAGGFHCDGSLLFKATTELVTGYMRIGQIKDAQSSLFCLFFFNKCTLNYWQSSLISRVQKKLILTTFANVLAFMEERIFRGS